MALAFLLNPSRRKKASRKSRRRCATRSRRCRPCRPGRTRRRPSRKRSLAAKRAWARRVAGKVHVTPKSWESKPTFSLNPRSKRRGSKGGRSMARRSSKRRHARKKSGGHRRRRGWTVAKRRRAGRKSWRKRLRRYPKKRSSVGRRGYKNNPRRRSRRRRNPLAIRGGMYSNPRRKRRRRSRRNPLAIRGGMYSNPRRRKGGRRRSRRNPFSLGGGIGSIKSKLMSPAAWIQAGVGAAGLTVSAAAAAIIMKQVRSFTTKQTGLAFDNPTIDSVLQAISTVAAGVLIAGFLPERYKAAFAIGASAGAMKPFVDMALAPALSATGLVGIPSPGGGIGAWISAGQMRTLGQGTSGMGAWITANQMRRLGQGTAGLRGGLGRLGAAWDYGVPLTSLDDYSRQPVATMNAAIMPGAGGPLY